jgi:glucosamine--fructose-6-phosphate aminotransferase (isomerizing)
MAEQGMHTRREILGQTAAWRAALDEFQARKDALRAFWEEGQFSDLVLVGCGSTYYLSLAVAPLFQSLLPLHSVRVAPGSELLLFPETVLPRGGKPVLLAISRSGRTTETVRAARAFRERTGAPVWAISCYESSPLVQESDLALVAAEGKEESVVQTRSFTSMLLLAQASAWFLAHGEPPADGLPAAGDRLFAEFQGLARELGEDLTLQRFFFLGSGPQYGLACEAALKVKEMTLSHAEAFHFMEFRHGPMSLVDQATLVVGLLSERAWDYEVEVLREMRTLGARVLALAEAPGKGPLPADGQVFFASGVPEPLRGVLYVPLLQWMACCRALRKGLDPDVPKHLSAVVVL